MRKRPPAKLLYFSEEIRERLARQSQIQDRITSRIIVRYVSEGLARDEAHQGLTDADHAATATHDKGQIDDPAKQDPPPIYEHPPIGLATARSYGLVPDYDDDD